MPLYHKFDKLGLYINPIVHAQPQPYYMTKMHTERLHAGEAVATEKIDPENYMRSAETDHLVKLALDRNRSNCIYVYSHNSRQSDEAVEAPSGERRRVSDFPYYVANLDSLLVPSGFSGDPAGVPAGAVSRECVVTVADVGCTLDPTELRRRVEEAVRLTGLETIDCVVWRATEDCMFDFDAFDACVAELNRMCSVGEGGRVAARQAQFFGIYFYNIPPYCYYTPPRAL